MSSLAPSTSSLFPMCHLSQMIIETFGARKPYSLRRKVALFELFDSLLQELPGEVDLAQPEHVIAMIEDACAPAALSGKA